MDYDQFEEVWLEAIANLILQGCRFVLVGSGFDMRSGPDPVKISMFIKHL